jgi:hypothetical protein
MNINDIITEAEYTKERSAKELFEWFTQKEKELWTWSQEQSTKIKHKELSKGLPDKFAHELTPFAYYAKTYYGDIPNVKFKPCCGSEQYDGIIIDNGPEILVEITNAIFGEEWAVMKEVLAEKGIVPWAYDILGVNKKNRAEKKKEAIDIIAGGEERKQVNHIFELRKLVKKTTEDKCVKSLDALLPYGQNKTILIVTFDDTIIRPSTSKEKWDDFVNFKHSEIDSMKHNFKKIILLGWLDKRFID